MSAEDLSNLQKLIDADPEKAIQLLSGKAFLNSLFHARILELNSILQRTVQKSQSSAKSSSSERRSNLDRVVVCMYSVVLFKSSVRLFECDENNRTVFNAKLAVEALTQVYRNNSSSENIRKIVTALLYKIPSFSNYKTYVKDINPELISMGTMRRVAPCLRSTAPNLFEQKLNEHKNGKWGELLAYSPFSLENFSNLMKEVQSVDSQSEPQSQKADKMAHLRQQIRREGEYLKKKISVLESADKFLIHEFCLEFDGLYSQKIQIDTDSMQYRISSLSKQNIRNNSIGNLSINAFSLQTLKVQVWCECKNSLLEILILLVAKLSTFWTRKLKWLYGFMTSQVEMYNIDSATSHMVQQNCLEDCRIAKEKLKELKLTVRLVRTFYEEFGSGLMPEARMKGILFGKDYSFYKLAEALLYNDYDFEKLSSSTGSGPKIANFQRQKKQHEHSQNGGKGSLKSVQKMIELNSKSLNINPHYDHVFEKVVPPIINLATNSAALFSSILLEVWSLYELYYKTSKSRSSGAEVIYLIENCKNRQIVNQRVLMANTQLKGVLFAGRERVQANLQFFCEDVWKNHYQMKLRQLQDEQMQSRNSEEVLRESEQLRSSLNVNVGQSEFKSMVSENEEPDVSYFNNLSSEKRNTNTPIQSSSSFDSGAEGQRPSSSKVIRKTRSEDMVIEGWTSSRAEVVDHSQKLDTPPEPLLESKGAKLNGSDVFYSIKQCSVSDECDNLSGHRNEEKSNERKHSEKGNENESQNEDLILTPEF